MFFNKVAKQVVHIAAIVMLMSTMACEDGNLANFFGEVDLSWQSGFFEDEGGFKNLCETPRSGTDPLTGNGFPDRQGSILEENFWLRSWSNNSYLWYDEISDQDPALFSTTASYFQVLKTSATTASGNPKDRFHFTYPTEVWQQLTQAGVSAGYGAKWAVISSSPPRLIRIAYTEPGTTATENNLARGTEVLQVDGVDVVNAADQESVDVINAGLFPNDVDETHTFVIRDIGSTETRSVTLVSGSITAAPVQKVTSFDSETGKVGYLLFNSHIQTAEAALIEAFNQLSSDGVTDLVLDLRYNGGGLLAIASQLAYMVAGTNIADGKTFEKLTFNDKYPNTNPITGSALTPTPFYQQTLGFSATQGEDLPSLNLSRVFILATGRTCSASESIINGLRGVGVEVILIGSTTCGKPYGFYATDNCGTTYFTIQFKGENELGFGDYSDGFSPANTVGGVGEIVTGCSVEDDYLHQLGDPLESQLAGALSYRETNVCPTPSGEGLSIYADEENAQPGSLFNSDHYRRQSLITNNVIIEPQRQ